MQDFLRCLFILTVSMQVNAAVYQCKDTDGRVSFKDTPCKHTENHENAAPQGITFESIQGRWQVLSIDGVKEGDSIVWEFEGDAFTQIFNEKRTSPDFFTVKGKTIDFRFYLMDVLEFDDQKMQASIAGTSYQLKRIPAVIITPKAKVDNQQARKNIEQSAQEVFSGNLKTVSLNCQDAVKNSQDWIRSMLSVGTQNYRDGHMSQAEYTKASESLRSMQKTLTVADCSHAQGNKKKFYQCASAKTNHLAQCGKTYPY